jgi:hypothetical protein
MTLGGKAGWTPASRSLVESGEAFLEETFSPLADDLPRCIELIGDLVVTKPVGSAENDLCPEYIFIL